MGRTGRAWYGWGMPVLVVLALLVGIPATGGVATRVTAAVPPIPLFTQMDTYTVGGYPGAVVPSDFNGDGKADPATIDASSGISNNVTVLIGTGTGTFAVLARYTAGNGSSALVTADFNGDGIRDLATANTYSSDVSVLLGNGDGTFRVLGSFTGRIGWSWATSTAMVRSISSLSIVAAWPSRAARLW